MRDLCNRGEVGTDGRLLCFNTRKNCFALLSAAMNLAVVEGLIRKNPCDGVKIVRPEHEEEYRGHALSPEQCERLLTAARNRWLYALIYTKCRDIDIDGELLAVLRAQWDLVLQRRHDPEAGWSTVDYNLVFPSEVGTSLNDRNLIRAYKGLLRRAELPDITFHDLRHTAGARYAEVAEVLGHSSLKVTQDIYAHAFPETRREAVSGLGRLLKRAGGA